MLVRGSILGDCWFMSFALVYFFLRARASEYVCREFDGVGERGMGGKRRGGESNEPR